MVDDDHDEREVVQILLERDGFAVSVAADGASALAAVRAEPPDVMLLDLHMPGLDGFQVLDAIKSDPAIAGVGVIVVSASSRESDVVRALERGATDYVAKPFGIEILLARVRAVLRSQAEKQAIRTLGDELRRAEEELARTRRHAALGAVAAGLAHEINNPAAFVVTDLHEVKELALDLADAGDETRAEALAALADEALSGMARIRDVVRDLYVFASADRRSVPAGEPLDLAAIVGRRVDRLASDGAFLFAERSAAWVAPGLGGEDELDALVGLVLRHAAASGGAHVVTVAHERERVVLQVGGTPSADASSELAMVIARELAERFGGSVAAAANGWTLSLPSAAPG